MTVSRTRMLTGSAAALASIAILRGPARAAQFSYKIANDQTATHPMNVHTAEAIKRIFDATGGALEIKQFPNSVLGGDPQMLSQARSGALDFMQVGNNVLGTVVPASALINIPFAFASAKQLMAAADGPLGAYVATLTGKIGLRTFAHAFYGGTFQMENSLRPINTPADLKGMKMRVPPGPIDVATFKALGASPAVVSLGEVYTSLQTHLVDAIEVPLPTVQNFKFYEQVKYAAITSHSGLAYFLTANPDSWSRLPKNIQEIVEREFASAAQSASAAFAAQETTAESALRAAGMQFTRPEIEPFRALVRGSGLYAQWRDQFDPKGWDALEQTTGKLTSA